MSKLCPFCNSPLNDTDRFCNNCGAIQETFEDNDEYFAEQPLVKKKSKKAVVFVAVSLAAVLAMAVVLVVCFGNFGSKGLMPLDEVEERLSEAYITAREGYADGVSDFVIEDVNEATHDQTFGCMVEGSSLNGIGAMGLAKDGKVIQIQVTYLGTESTFQSADTGMQAVLVSMPLFPISIFEEDIDTCKEFIDFIYEMDDVSEETQLPDAFRKVNGDIEYTYMGGVGDGIVMYTFTIRYLPAFDTGYFEDDSDESSTQSNNVLQSPTEDYTVSASEFVYGNKEFFDCDTIELVNIYTLPEVNNNYMGKPSRWATVDLDSDGIEEILIEYSINGDTAILRLVDNNYYAYYIPFRGILNLKKDGTMSWSSGASVNGVQRLAFSGREIEYIDTIVHDTMDNIFMVDGVYVSLDECNAALRQQYQKENVEWTEI